MVGGDVKSMNASKISVDLTCGQCGTFFRLHPKPGRPRRSTIPCPRCRTLVVVRWPWLPGAAHDPLDEPAPTAVLLRAGQTPSPAPAPQSKPRGRITPAQSPRVVTRADEVAEPTPTPANAQAAQQVLQDFKSRVRRASQELAATSPEGGHGRYAPRPGAALDELQRQNAPLQGTTPWADTEEVEALVSGMAITDQVAACTDKDPPLALAPTIAPSTPPQPPEAQPDAEASSTGARRDRPELISDELQPVSISELVAANDDAVADLMRSRRRSRWLWAASVAVITSVGGYAGWWVHAHDGGRGRVSTPVTVSAPATPDDAMAAAAPSALTPQVEPQPMMHAKAVHHVKGATAQAMARAHVVDAAHFERKAIDNKLADARRALDEAQPDAALAEIESADALIGLQDAEQFVQAAEVLIAARRYDEARKLLRRGRDRFPGSTQLRERLHHAFEADNVFLPPVVNLPDAVTQIRKLGGGSTVTLKFKQGDETVAAFKPLQTRRQSNYRSEIASWRLCQLLNCSFEIPYNRPVRIGKKAFKKRYPMTSSKQRGYAQQNFEDLIWTRDADGKFLYGTEKAWVKDFTKFPIEYEKTWRDWLKLSASPDVLDLPLEDALRGWLRKGVTQKHYQPLIDRAQGTTTRDVARQLSDMLVFDFLVGNWDRYSGVKKYWGANCHFTKGHLLSIDNGAAFPTYTAPRVRRRFAKVERFSRSLIHELRLLNKDATLRWLFPNASASELKRFELFWQQRNKVLERVDGLIEDHGEAAVLAFP